MPDNDKLVNFEDFKAVYDTQQVVIGPVEATSTATALHNTGTYFLFGGTFYRAIGDIAVGDTITPGTNCVVAETGDELYKLYSVDNVYGYLVNDGNYTIKASDLESGLWNFSAKLTSNTRARTRCLIPVRAGMKISYTNITYDVFFGVLETPTSGSYIQVIGWKTNENGTIDITKDGYLTFVIRNHANNDAAVNPADFDGTVIIETVLYQKVSEIKIEFDEYLINDGQYTIKASDLESGLWDRATKRTNSTRARTKYLLPVRSGMSITYSNTTYDIYWGILETPTSTEYITGTSGWRTGGSGTEPIEHDGWLTFVIKNHNDDTLDVDPSEYNSVVTIKTALRQLIDAMA